MKESGIWEKFFSVKISPLKTHKIVSICGLKLKFRCDGNRKALEKLRATIRENSVLIVETNTCHYEVIPGYAKYFSELGYNVDVAVYDGGQLDFLCEAVPTVRGFTLGEKDMDKLLGAAPIRAYHYILFSSAIKYVDGVEVNSPKMPLVTSYYHNIAADQKKMIFVQHHMEETLKAFHVTGHHILIARHGLGVGKENTEHAANVVYHQRNSGFFCRFQQTFCQTCCQLIQRFVNARLRDFIQTGETSSHRNRVTGKRTRLIDRTGRGQRIHYITTTTECAYRHSTADDFAEAGEIRFHTVIILCAS